MTRKGVRTYPGTTALLARLRAAGIPVGLVTASRNARALLAAADVDNAFDVINDGEAVCYLATSWTPDLATSREAKWDQRRPATERSDQAWSPQECLRYGCGQGFAKAGSLALAAGESVIRVDSVGIHAGGRESVAQVSI